MGPAGAGQQLQRRQVGCMNTPVARPAGQVDADHLLDGGVLACLVYPGMGFHEQFACLLAGGCQVQAQARQQANVVGLAAMLLRAT
ncbi:hypothetical protein D3C79_953180 [compost metagenome]